MRIAMWSGPRNLSTAMMYSFAARGDCAVWDEPFYAAYLAATGIEHPMRDEILAAGEQNAAEVAAVCMGESPNGKAHFYQKHMTQHMRPDVPRDWMAKVRNVFLIRHPARVIASYAKKRENPSLDDLGFRLQFELYEYVKSLGQIPIVIDSADIRANPEKALKILCKALDLDFAPAMLSWSAGGLAADGVWAPHWYGAVHLSTGFLPPEGDLPELSAGDEQLAGKLMTYYNTLFENRI